MCRNGRTSTIIVNHLLRDRVILLMSAWNFYPPKQSFPRKYEQIGKQVGWQSNHMPPPPERMIDVLMASLKLLTTTHFVLNQGFPLLTSLQKANGFLS